MALNVMNVVYYLALTFACIVSMSRYKILDKGSRILAILVCCAFINECTADYMARRYHTNLPLYSIYCFLEYGLLCFYFNQIIDVFRKNRIGIYVAAAGILLGVINIIYLQDLHTLNSYFLFLEGLTVIAMSFLTFFRLLLRDDIISLYRYYHFWFITTLIFFWSITFLSWGLYDYIARQLPHDTWIINFMLMSVGAITYGSFGVIFLLYPKLQSINE